MKRKFFIKNMAASESFLLASPLLFNACSNGTDDVIEETEDNEEEDSSSTIDLANSSHAELATVGGYVYKDNLIIIRASETQYVALSKICTHEQCTVDYDADTNQLPCYCHGSLFNISGGVINGPAKSNLKKYSVKVDGNNLIIS